MKILYITRRLGSKQNGAKQVMARNFEALQRIFGKENVTEYYLPKADVKNVLFSLLQGGSYGVTKHEEVTILRIVKDLSPDFVFLESSCFGSIYKRLAKEDIKTICFAHNLDTELCHQERSSRSLLVGLLKYGFTWWNEKRTTKYANVLICLTRRDSDGFLRMFGRNADLILPITFNNRKLLLSSLPPPLQPYYLFVGSDFFPNVEGVKWFVQNVAPKVNVKFRIVGSCCDNLELKKLTLPDNVQMVGYVSNLDEEYLKASGVIAPIFKGSGMKTKTVEAMSYGKSIIGTDEAFQGIECDYSRIGAKCNTAEEFIQAIKSLPDRQFNPYVYQLFSDNYETSVVENRLKSFLDEFYK